MIYAGCDLGIVSAKAALVDDQGRVLALKALPYRRHPREAAVAAMEQAMDIAGLTGERWACCLSTGFGKKAVAFADDTAHSEFCLQRALSIINPHVRTVVDVGGHTINAFNIGRDARICESAVIDKCVAGTGLFLEAMTKALELTLEKFSRAYLGDREPVAMSNQCVILAESEVISLVSEGHDRLDILAGVASAVASRVVGLAKRIDLLEEVALVGGVAKVYPVSAGIEKRLGLRVADLQGTDPQVLAALGAALLARDSEGQIDGV